MPDSHARGIICEELVTSLDSWQQALILRQLLYWVPRMKDTDEYLEEVGADGTSAEQDDLRSHGWIYKTAEDLSKEVLALSPKTTRRHLKKLVERGLVDERENPDQKWDRTLQYRVNLADVERLLNANGYTLKTVMGADFPALEPHLDRNGQDKSSSRQNVGSNSETVASRSENGDAIPKTTTETTTKTTAESAPAPVRGDDPVAVFNQEVGSDLSAYEKDLIRQKVSDLNAFRRACQDSMLNVKGDADRVSTKVLLDQYEERVDKKSGLNHDFEVEDEVEGEPPDHVKRQLDSWPNYG